jgi:hypothetical protein
MELNLRRNQQAGRHGRYRPACQCDVRNVGYRPVHILVFGSAVKIPAPGLTKKYPYSVRQRGLLGYCGTNAG